MPKEHKTQGYPPLPMPTKHKGGASSTIQPSQDGWGGTDKVSNAKKGKP